MESEFIKFTMPMLQTSREYDEELDCILRTHLRATMRREVIGAYFAITTETSRGTEKYISKAAKFAKFMALDEHFSQTENCAPAEILSSAELSILVDIPKSAAQPRR